MEIVDLLSDTGANLDDIYDTSHALTQVKDLISAGCDVNAPDIMGMRPLHLAVTHSMLDVAQELIKAGADINIQDHFFEGTPLHHAIKVKDGQAVCMLLYYGADVNIVHCNDFTPLMYALDMDTVLIPHILLDYYDDFNDTNKNGRYPLLLAVQKQHRIAIDLVKRGAHVTIPTLLQSLWYKNAALFKSMWCKIDHRILLNPSLPFIIWYLEACRFAPSEWLECMYLILESPCAFDFVDDAMTVGDTKPTPQFRFHKIKLALWPGLLLTFHKKTIAQDDRIAIIYTCLNLGATADFKDAIAAYKFYGFGEELEALMYVYDNEGKDTNANFLLPSFILAQARCSTNVAYELLKKQILHSPDASARNTMVGALKFFALPLRFKRELIKACEKRPTNHTDRDDISKKVLQVPEIASLVELSRNALYEIIKQAHNVHKPYQFHDAVKRLKVPQLIKDIIRFKTPIY